MGIQTREHSDRIWSVVLNRDVAPPKECWFARGPSGHLLGGYGTDDEALDAVRKDVEAFAEEVKKAHRSGERPPIARPAGTVRHDDPVALAADRVPAEGSDESLLLPDASAIWPMRCRNETIVYVAEYRDGRFSASLEAGEVWEQEGGPL